MPDSIREQIIAKVATKLTTASVTNFRSFNEALHPAKLPCVVIVPGEERRLDGAGRATSKRRLTLGFVVLAEGRPADQAADALAVKVWQTLLAYPRTLDGLAINMYEGDLAWEIDSAETDLAQVAITIDVDYVHKDTDPTELP